MSADAPQHKATFKTEAGFAFDDAGVRVPVTPPIFPGDDAALLDGATERHEIGEALRIFIELLTNGFTALQAGQMLHILAFDFGVSQFPKQCDLASWLNVSSARITQIRQQIPQKLRANKTGS